MQDANVGTLIGSEIHLFPEVPNLFTTETNEKSTIFEIDIEGFNLYMRGYLEEKYDKYSTFLKGLPFLKQTRANKKAFYSLVMMM